MHARLSADGNTLVVGAQLDDTIGENAGSARIFRFDATEDEWKQIGQSLYGEAAGSRFGTYPHTSRDGQTVPFPNYHFHNDHTFTVMMLTRMSGSKMVKTLKI